MRSLGSSAVGRRLWRPLFACLALLAASAVTSGAQPVFSLDVRASVRLEKNAGRVDQVVPLPGGGWAVRDYSFDPPDRQRVELFAADGRRSGEIAAYGRGPERYVRLKDIAVDRQGDLWIADFGSARVLRFNRSGKLLSSVLLQNPSFRPNALALDEERGRLFVAGCYPTDIYLDRGCLLVHRYRLADGRFEGSFVETDPEALAKRWAGRSDYDLTVAPNGDVYFVDEGVHTLVLLDPESGRVAGFAVQSGIATPPASLSLETVASSAAKTRAIENSYRLTRVQASGAHVITAMSKPGGRGELLTVFDGSGRTVARDLELPGRLVGATTNGGWIFARRERQGFVLDFAYPSARSGR